MDKSVNISNAIRDAAKNMIKFYFESNFSKDFELNVIKNNLLAHIDQCKITGIVTKKGSKVSIEQKVRNIQDVSRN
jgi:hypothetical protein